MTGLCSDWVRYVVTGLGCAMTALGCVVTGLGCAMTALGCVVTGLGCVVSDWVMFPPGWVTFKIIKNSLDIRFRVRHTLLYYFIILFH